MLFLVLGDELMGFLERAFLGANVDLELAQLVMCLAELVFVPDELCLLELEQAWALVRRVFQFGDVAMQAVQFTKDLDGSRHGAARV